ncbi:hypothetical protein M0802_016048 [Mischocyttarus mexicanus]|nr:hypothetical protein M0802_016048 [Mischocyttarus mexicanus]
MLQHLRIHQQASGQQDMRTKRGTRGSVKGSLDFQREFVNLISCVRVNGEPKGHTPPLPPPPPPGLYNSRCALVNKHVMSVALGASQE